MIRPVEAQASRPAHPPIGAFAVVKRFDEGLCWLLTSAQV